VLFYTLSFVVLLPIARETDIERVRERAFEREFKREFESSRARGCSREREFDRERV
jgi:hypothetical protein